MADDKKTTTAKKPTIPKKPTKNASNKQLEKIAVNPNLPVENLLDEFLRQSLTPNVNDGNNYYIGHVVGVLDSKSKIGMFDIFNDSTSNLERFFSNKNKRETKDVKKLIVHIPELFSVGDYAIDTENDILNYVTKFRINYSGATKIKIGDLVKVVFKNNTTFTDPEILSVSDFYNESIIKTRKDSLKEKINSYLECRITQLAGSQGSPINLDSIFFKLPTSGYYQLFNEISLLLSKPGYINFASYLGKIDKENFIKELSQIKYQLFCDNKVKAIAELNSNLKTLLTGKILQKSLNDPVDQLDYEVYLKISTDNIDISNNKDNLKQLTSYIQERIADKHNFVIENLGIFNTEGSTTNNQFFLLKIDVNLSSDVSVDENVDSYIQKSEEIKNGGIPSTSGQETSITTAANTAFVQQNSNTQQCENPAAVINEYYINIKDIQKYKRNIDDRAYVDYFLNKPSDTLPIPYPSAKEKLPISSLDILSPKNLKLAGQYVKEKKNPFVSFEDLKKENINFYRIPDKIAKLNQKAIEKGEEIIDINSNFDNENKNFISEQALQFRIKKISNFLTQLKYVIARNEFVDSASDKKIIDTEKEKRVLILPINVIRIKKGKSEYKFSRHYFGQAVDFTVYIKDLNDEIYQIPPEIVYLYCKKTMAGSNELYGNGIFFNEMYNHFEFVFINDGEENLLSLDNTKNLTQDEKRNGRLWVSGELPEGLKKIQDLTIEKLDKEIINYITKKASNNQKILRLTR